MTSHLSILLRRGGARLLNGCFRLQVPAFRFQSFFLLSISVFCLLLSAFPVRAQSQQSAVTAEIKVSKAQLYERETFLLTLTIKTIGVQIRQTLDLAGLPDKRQVDLFTDFETLPTERIADGHRITEVHRYRCRARPLVTGTLRIAPTLRLTAVRRRRLFIGSAWEEFPVKVPIHPLVLTVEPLPTPPADFSGAIGALDMQASIDPSDVAPGDLITVTTRISGESYLEGMRVPEVTPPPQFKAYDAKQVHTDDNLRVYEQIVIPQATNITAVPAVSFTYFDTRKGDYTRATRGPFPITFHAAPEARLEHFRPSEVPSASASSAESPTPISTATRIRNAFGRARYEQGICRGTTQARLAPATGSLPTFEIPAKTQVDILSRFDEWILIESDRRRGWIPQSALQQD